MKQVVLDRYGRPEEVARCAEVADVGAPARGEVVFDVLAFPINPADISFCRGTYRLRPALPATPGAECVGRVTAIGSGVAHVKVGDLVINLQRENWAQKRRVKGEDVIAISPRLDLRQAAMLRINPPTALLLLTDVVELGRGDWVIQNVANSAVGRLLIRLARARGLRTVNVVRRAELVAPLRAIGADVVLTDGPDLDARVRAAIGDGALPLAIDAVGGSATQRLARCVSDGGTVVNYGVLSGEPCLLDGRETVFRDVRLRGFWLRRWFAQTPPDKIAAVYRELAARLGDGRLAVEVEAVYPVRRIKEALAHAARGGRSGKILVSFEGA